MAWGASANNVDRREGIGANCSDITKQLDFRPVFGENLGAKFVVFYLPDDVTETRPLQAKLETAHAGEQRSDAHRLPLYASRRCLEFAPHRAEHVLWLAFFRNTAPHTTHVRGSRSGFAFAITVRTGTCTGTGP